MSVGEFFILTVAGLWVYSQLCVYLGSWELEDEDQEETSRGARHAAAEQR